MNSLHFTAGEDIEAGQAISQSEADGLVYRAVAPCHPVATATEPLQKGNLVDIANGQATVHQHAG